MELNPEAIVRCFGCERSVRAKVTSLEPTGEDGFSERWCLECLDSIDQHSSFLLSDPNNLPPPSEGEDDIQRFLLDY